MVKAQNNGLLSISIPDYIEYNDKVKKQTYCTAVLQAIEKFINKIIKSDHENFSILFVS